MTYYTPRIEGFQLGLSYSPDTAQDSNTQPNRDAVDSDLIMLGVNFKRSFGNVGVGLSGGFGTVSDAPDVADSNEPTAFNLGATASVGGFGLGVSYAQADESGADDGEAINVGVSYSQGPWGISAVYFHGERDGTGSAGLGTLTGQAEQDTIHLSAKYALGPGVTALVLLGYPVEVSSDDSACCRAPTLRPSRAPTSSLVSSSASNPTRRQQRYGAAPRTRAAPFGLRWARPRQEQTAGSLLGAASPVILARLLPTQ